MNKILAGVFVFLFSVNIMALAWTVRVQGTAWETETLNSVVYGNGLFIAAGNFGAAFRSTDGIQWTESPISPNSFASFEEIIWDSTLFVAVGSSGIIFTSSNGSEWTDRSSSIGNTDIYFESVAAGDGGYVAVGWEGGTSGGHRIYTSSDATSWTAKTSPVTTSSDRLYDVVWGDGRFVAVGNNGVVMTSSDGVDWTVQTTPATQALFCVAFVDGLYYAGGGEMDAYLITSPDAVTWTRRTTPMIKDIYSDPIQDIIAFGDNVAAVCRYLYTSTDGTVWKVEDLSKVADGEVFYSATLSDEIAVLVGQHGTTISTPISGLVTSSLPHKANSQNARGYALQQIFSNHQVGIGFTLPQDQSRVVVSLCDMQGRRVRTIFSGALKAGQHTRWFDASVLSPGQYICRLESAFGVCHNSLVVTAR
ncbi:MAG: hypothetical protein JW915_17440 [Chitinispirillaceae bacterium]|nr:hypothetical protein [Chitinispirillaceae bacterium]